MRVPTREVVLLTATTGVVGTALVGVTGIIALALKGERIPESLITLTSAAAGCLAGVVATFVATKEKSNSWPDFWLPERLQRRKGTDNEDAQDDTKS